MLYRIATSILVYIGAVAGAIMCLIVALAAAPVLYLALCVGIWVTILCFCVVFHGSADVLIILVGALLAVVGSVIIPPCMCFSLAGKLTAQVLTRPSRA